MTNPIQCALDNFQWLIDWYAFQCDGDWEHGKGVHIGTLGNPGWYIKIDLIETELEGKKFEEIFIERSEENWFYCNKIGNVFQGDCGPFNLLEVLQIFKDWVESNS